MGGIERISGCQNQARVDCCSKTRKAPKTTIRRRFFLNNFINFQFYHIFFSVSVNVNRSRSIQSFFDKRDSKSDLSQIKKLYTLPKPYSLISEEVKITSTNMSDEQQQPNSSENQNKNGNSSLSTFNYSVQQNGSFSSSTNKNDIVYCDIEFDKLDEATRNKSGLHASSHQSNSLFSSQASALNTEPNHSDSCEEIKNALKDENNPKHLFGSSALLLSEMKRLKQRLIAFETDNAFLRLQLQQKDFEMKYRFDDIVSKQISSNMMRTDNENLSDTNDNLNV